MDFYSPLFTEQHMDTKHALKMAVTQLPIGYKKQRERRISGRVPALLCGGA